MLELVIVSLGCGARFAAYHFNTALAGKRFHPLETVLA